MNDLNIYKKFYSAPSHIFKSTQAKQFIPHLSSGFVCPDPLAVMRLAAAAAGNFITLIFFDPELCGGEVAPVGEEKPKDRFLAPEEEGRDFFCVICGDVLEASDMESSLSLATGLPLTLEDLLLVVLVLKGLGGLRPATGFLTGT